MVARAILLWLFLVSLASAETVDVPLLPDGTVNIDAVLATFDAEVPSPVLDIGGEINGTILGGVFTATYGETNEDQSFDLEIVSNSLSQHATYLAAVLIIDMICLNRDIRPNHLRWHETSVKIDGGWKVQASCTNDPS